MGHIAYQIDDELHQRAKVCAAREGVTLKAWIEQAIADRADAQEAADLDRRR